jgi:hypothetical protein
MTSALDLWRQGRPYDVLSGYLAARNLSMATRALMAALTLSYIGCLVALLISRDGPHGSIPVTMTWIACAGGVAALTLWVWRWPTRAQSVTFAVTLFHQLTTAVRAQPASSCRTQSLCRGRISSTKFRYGAQDLILTSGYFSSSRPTGSKFPLRQR